MGDGTLQVTLSLEDAINTSDWKSIAYAACDALTDGANRENCYAQIKDLGACRGRQALQTDRQTHIPNAATHDACLSRSRASLQTDRQRRIPNAATHDACLSRSRASLPVGSPHQPISTPNSPSLVPNSPSTWSGVPLAEASDQPMVGYQRPVTWVLGLEIAQGRTP
jgi:hypothetical protein